MNRISKMLLLLILVILPVVLFILDNKQVWSENENAKDFIPAKDPSKSAEPVYSAWVEYR